MATYSSQLLKGTFQTIILQLLSQNEKMYGYEITQKVKQLSKGEITLSEGSLYPILHKMEEEGLVTTTRVNIGNRPRKYYAITKPGRLLGLERVKEFNRFINTMSVILNPNLT